MEALESAGVDIFHCSTHYFWKNEFENSEETFAGWVKKLSKKTTITVGSIGLNNSFVKNLVVGENSSLSSFRILLEKYNKNEFDLIAFGRLLIANPDLVEKLKSGNLNDLLPFKVKMLEKLK